MSTEVEDFDIRCTENGTVGLEDELAVFGRPFHETKEGVISKYVENGVDQFVRDEQVTSCGNYLLVDDRKPEETRIITSPGYCSGYAFSGPSSIHVSTLLANLVSDWKQSGNTIDERYLKLFYKLRPFQGTPFSGVKQIRPATTYRIESGELRDASCYLAPTPDSPDSVEEAMRRCAASLSGRSVTVMFSGGLDSLSWYLILASELGEENVDLATMDWRPGSEGQGPYLARPVAEELGIDLQVISFDDGWVSDDEKVVDHTTSWLSKDVTIDRNPLHAFAGVDHVNDIIINLTNNESLLTLQMNHLYRKKFVNRKNSLMRNVNMAGFVFFNQYIKNVPYTARYMRNHSLRGAYFGIFWPLAKLVDMIHPRGVGIDLGEAGLDDIDLSRGAILNSIIAKNAPNIKPKEHATTVRKEVDEISRLIDDPDIHHLSRLLYYYGHMAYASNMLEKLPITGPDARTYLPTTWGPMISSCMFDDLGFGDVIHPRSELLDIVESETGRSFSELRPLEDELQSDDRISTGEYREDVYSSIVAKHGSLLSPQNSKVLEYMGSTSQGDYERELRNIESVADHGRGDFASAIKAVRMLNLELLLREGN